MPHYKLTAPSGKSYHGITTLSVNRRMTGHKTAARNGSTYPLHAAIRKYGFENFKLEVLNPSVDLEELHQLEIEAIARDNTLTPNGYNLTAGGEGTKNHTVSATHREIIGERMKARWQDPAFVKMRKANASETALRLANTPDHREKFAAASRKYWSNPDNVAARSEKIRMLRKAEPERFSSAIASMREGCAKHWINPENIKRQSENTAKMRALQPVEKRKAVAMLAVAKRAENKLAREQYLASLPVEEAEKLRAEARAKKSAETKAGRARATPEQKEASRERYRQAALRRHAAKKASTT